MSEPTGAAAPAKRKRGRPRGRPGARIEGGSREARRQAAAILEVLAGARTPADAAGALGVSVPRYYALETQALGGLVVACEPRSRGPTASPEREIEQLRKENRRLEGELRRQQALARAAGRAVGLGAPKPVSEKTPGKRRRKRKPTARALKLASRLESTPPAAVPETAGP